MAMTLESSAFKHEGDIPEIHTGEGKDLSPPLQWANAPKGTKGFVLIVDDPDAPDPKAPKMTWVHWVLYNIPGAFTRLPAGAHPLPIGTAAGTNDWNHASYGGPMPPIGKHRYFFKLYALDTLLDFISTPTKPEVEAAMEGHILEQATLIGLYKSKKSKG